MADSRQGPCARLRRSRETSRQGPRRTSHYTGEHLGEGIEAASEVVSTQAYLDAVLQKAPKNSDKLNLEAVIEANVTKGHPGQPTVVVAVRTLVVLSFGAETLYDTFP
jgi:hypothetical protein